MKYACSCGDWGDKFCQNVVCRHLAIRFLQHVNAYWCIVHGPVRNGGGGVFSIRTANYSSFHTLTPTNAWCRTPILEPTLRTLFSLSESQTPGPPTFQNIRAATLYAEIPPAQIYQQRLSEPTMSRSFQPISDVINTSSSRHKQQSFNEIYGEPENFLEIEVSSAIESP